ncbi:MAG: major outer membrane protein [Campylobacter lanienae]|uniref:major outer membrane protein n=1 Tax=Campylobacter lanienae TaxID=75658 RepID=UPI00242B042A|nr:major outer membrane protein [Campylobacter lanienae]MCI5540071.1 major outer membrane protein [Campylobacter lanienae]
MKLVKLSLATIVAAGALSSVASAASLEEAIKNVDVSGYARYRYDAKNTNTSTEEFNGNTHRFTTDIDFKSAIDDNFFGVIGFRYDSKDKSGERAGADTKVGQALNVRQFYLGYTAGNTTIQAGRQVLGTFFTDDMVGTGIKFLNKDITGLTLAGIAFDNLQADGDIGTSDLNIGANGDQKVYDRNLYGVAAIGSYDPVSFQVWYAALDSVAQLYALDVTLGANLGGADLSLQAQYAGSAMWANSANNGAIMLDDGQFWAIKAGAEAFGFDASVGYVNIDTKNNRASLISFEDQGDFITAGQDLLDYTLVQADQSIYFVTAGYKFNDYLRVGADYVGAKYDNEISSYKGSEVVLRADYKYNKKLNFKAWFSNIDRDSGRDDVKHLRFEARYNF